MARSAAAAVEVCLEPLASATGSPPPRQRINRRGFLSCVGRARKSLPRFHARANFPNSRLQAIRAPSKFSKKLGRALGIGLAALVNTLNLPLYVIGGGLANSWNLFSPVLFERAALPQLCLSHDESGQSPTSGIPSQKRHQACADLGPEAGLLGACILPFHGAFHNNGRTAATQRALKAPACRTQMV